MSPGRLWRRLKDLVVHRILGVDDTPNRIAWGVFLGFMVAMTPTIGFQIVMYVAIASLLRGNKVAGIPILFISNPFTAVPLYWCAWWLGSAIMHGGVPVEPSEEAVRARVVDGSEAGEPWYTRIFTAEFWDTLGDQMLAIGAELWLGSIVLGLLTGIPGYFLTLWAVKRFRARRGRA
jgi:hypothetical protein